jgi:hypothetical protein
MAEIAARVDKSGFWRMVWAPLLVGLVLLWTATGTLAPYAASYTWVVPVGPCGYLYNVDHEQFRALYSFVSGGPRETWENSIMLRRFPYALLCLPLFKLLGFELGGLISNLIFYLLSLAVCLRFIFKTFGRRATAWLGWLLATSPLGAYWISMPYPYAWLTPCCLLALPILWNINRGCADRSLFSSAFLLGLLGLPHELLTYLFAFIFLYGAARRKLSLVQACISLVLVLLPQAAANAYLSVVVGVVFTAEHASLYSALFKSYFSSFWWQNLPGHLRTFVPALLHNALFSTLLFLPLVWAVLRVALFLPNAHDHKTKLSFGWVEQALLIGLFLQFCFLNLAAPQGVRFNLQGLEYARFYQPLICLLVLALARLSKLNFEANYLLFTRFLVGAAAALNILVVSGPLVNYPKLADFIYANYYGHAAVGTFTKNLEKYGRRPLGFCSHKAVGSAAQAAK